MISNDELLQVWNIEEEITMG
ncbi:unnamed protein product, partial [Rotaria sordida]